MLMKFSKHIEYLSKDNQIIITYPNFDPGYQYINSKLIIN